MANRRHADAEDFNQMRKMGMGLNPPLGKFSEQPGSGSAIGGRRGMQEYGINGGIAQEDAHDRQLSSNVDIDPADIEPQMFPIDTVDRAGAGISEYTAGYHSAAAEPETILPADELGGPQHRLRGDFRDGGERLLLERFKQHPAFRDAALGVRVIDDSEIELQGTVRSEAERLLAQELAEAIMPGLPIANRLEVCAGNP